MKPARGVFGGRLTGAAGMSASRIFTMISSWQEHTIR
jgi:hypothetical protein